MVNTIGIGLGEKAISQNPEDVLVAYGLGSCVGVGIYDPRSKLCGLLHAVLPERMNGSDPGSAKFVDSGIPALVDEMVRAGAIRSSMIIRIAGGANMLVTASLSKTFDIGTRNVASARLTLERLSFRLAAEDVGGNIGRTVRLYIKEGRMTVRVIGGQERDL